MSRMPSRRRPAASRPKSVLAKPSGAHPNQTPLFRAGQRELVTKRRGELAELAFTLKAASLGFAVPKPFGDRERYDVIVDARQLAPARTNRCRQTCPTMQAAHKQGAHKKGSVAMKGSAHVGTAASAVLRSEASACAPEASRKRAASTR